jgi:EmrB/QacA subfamily drug resistance transporter
MDASGAAAEVAGPGRWLVPTIALGTTLAPLNSTMIAVALPEIRSAFGVSITATAWLVTLYLVVMAAGQPIGGRLGDLYGRRRVYLFGLAWFGLASAGCAFAPNLGWLIACRALQALAGTLSFPNGTAMVREAVPAERRGAAFGTVGLATGIAAAAGPPLGGTLVHVFGWSAIFWANVPVIGIALVLGWTSLPRGIGARHQRARFDFAGTILLASALTLVILMPTVLRSGGWSLAAGVALGALLAAGGFVVWERRSVSPVVDVQLFAKRQFTAACAAILLGNLVMYTTILALPLYLEEVRGHSLQTVGMVLAAMSIFSAFLGPVGGRWADRSGRWLPATSGGLMFLMGTVVLAIAMPGTSIVPVIAGLAAMGLGLGIASASIQTAAVESVPLERTGSAAGVYSTSRYLGSVTGSTVLAALFAGEATSGEASRYTLLFIGLAVVALAALVANTSIASRRIPNSELVR